MKRVICCLVVCLMVMLGMSVEGKAANGVKQVELGTDSSAAIKSDSSLWMWGENDFGQLGDGTTANRAVPAKLMGNVASVNLGVDHSAAIKTDGSLWLWGLNSLGELGDGTTANRFVPTKLMDNVASVSLEYFHSAAIKTDGSLWMWGLNKHGQLGDDTRTNRLVPGKVMDNVVSVSLGNWHSAALKTDGSLWMWGYNNDGQLGDGTTTDRLVPTKIMDNVVSVSVGEHHSAAIKTDGSLWMWGRNSHGQLGDGTTTSRPVPPTKLMDNVASVSLGGYHSAAIKTDGSLWMWGLNSLGELGDGTTTDRLVPTKIMDNVASADSGALHSAVIKTDGSLWMWGYNSNGQLGDGTTTDSLIPIKIMDGNDTTDSFIVSRVKDYTSSFMNDRYNKIMADDSLSAEAKFQKINEFFNYYEMTDCKEGIAYLRDTFDERQAYAALTSDEVYCATRYKNYLHSDEGTGMRAALYASGLIFNGEYKEWLDPGTYITQETPGVKKYKAMLLDYMKNNVEEKQFSEYFKQSNEVLQNSGDILTAVEQAQAIEQLQSCKTIDQINGVFQKYIGKGTSKKFTLKMTDTVFTDALGYVGKSVDVIGAGAEDIELFLDMTSNLELYQKNKKIFTEIANSDDFPFEMRVAALQVEKQYEMRGETLFKKIAGDLASFVDEGITVAFDIEKWKVGKTSMGDINEALATIDIATWVTNQYLDVGSLVQKEASVEGYAYLAEHYARNLRVIKSQFLLEPSEEKAWAFYECYNTLHEMRLEAERSYLEMNKVDGILGIFANFGYRKKYGVAIETVKTLENDYGFDLTHVERMNDSTRYQKKIIAACPVDMEVYDTNGQLVYTIEDGKASDVTNELGRFVSLYRGYTEDYTKIAYLKDADNYSVRLVAREPGLVSASATEAVGEDSAATKAFDYESLDTGGTIAFTTNETETDYTVDKKGDGSQTTTGTMTAPTGDNETSVAVTGITTSLATCTLVEGEVIAVGIEVLPENATNKAVEWVSSNPDCAMVNNGQIRANKAGEADITVKALDGNYRAAVHVTVTPQPPVAGLYARTLTLEGNIGINFYMDLNSTLDPSTIYLKVWKDGKEGQATLLPYNADFFKENNGKKYYGFTYPVVAKEMADNINAKPVVMVDGKETQSGEAFNYSVQTYAKNMLASSATTEGLKALLVPMLNYGASAQNYFSYNKEALANADLSIEQKTIPKAALGEEYAASMSQGEVTAPTAKIYGNSLILESATAVRYYIDLEEGVDAANTRLMYRRATTQDAYTEVPLTLYKNNRYYAEIENIPAKKLGDMIEAHVEENGVQISETKTYGPMAYAKNKITQNTKETLVTLMNAMVDYREKAKVYFNYN